MKKLIILTFILLYSSSSIGQVDDKYTETLKTMFKVAGTQETYKTVINQMLNLFKKQYPSVDEKIWNELEEEFSKNSMNELVHMISPVYAKYLSHDELKQLITFYTSPLGQKVSKSTPLITQESMQIGQEWGRKIGQEFTERMKKEGY
ncbi:DUF2059 domain-containing protein [Aquimarina sp. 2201CG1-2-11]|uniref:DUF2059 domain-containing protein n=1 Tax=Aquimarina discodermiae TaxID=3231043 RepID=UPI0034634C2D